MYEPSSLTETPPTGCATTFEDVSFFNFSNALLFTSSFSPGSIQRGKKGKSKASQAIDLSAVLKRIRIIFSYIFDTRGGGY